MIRRYLKAILDNSPESIVLIGRNHEVLACNKTIKDVLSQYFKREIKEGDFYYPDFVIESNHKLYLEAFETAISGKQFYVQNYTKNEGAAFWFDYKMNPIYDVDGTLLGVCLSAKNITTEKEAELKISELSETLEAILNNTDVSVTLLDLNYRILTLNTVAAASIISNSGVKASVGSDFREFIEDKNNMFYKYYPKALRGENASVEILYHNAKGEGIWYQTRFNPVYNQSGELMGVSVFAADITEKKKLELSLKESDARFKKITAIAPVGIIITDSTFKINYANLAVKKMLLYEKEELHALYITDIISNLSLSGENKIRVDNLNLDIETPIFNQEQFVAITRSDRKIDVLISSNSFFSRDKLSYVFVIQDITEIRKKDDLIEEQNNKLKNIAWYQSHIIRAPLARIMGLISFLESTDYKLDIDKKEKEVFYKAILDSSHELDKVINDIIGNTL